MYGGVEKNEQMRRADQRFIDTVVSTGATRQQGSAHAVKRGLEAFQKADFNLAMRRFNQAWLLDPENPNAYHGFALVAIERDKDEAFAETMFRKALTLPAATPGTYSDFGLFLIRNKRYEEAVPLLEQGILMDPDYAPLRSHLAVALFFGGQKKSRGCEEARRALPRASATERPTLDAILASHECQRAG
jgi:Tfp pilus assembly protein PilF